MSRESRKMFRPLAYIEELEGNIDELKEDKAKLEGIIEKLMHSCELTKEEREICDKIDKWGEW